jgi:F0F1-type ATP synthase delta subunit
VKKYSRKKLACALPALLVGHPRRAVVQLVAAELVKNRSAHELPWLMRETAAAAFAATNTLTAQLTTARPVSAGTEKKVERLLKKATGAARISWEKKTDPGVLGGFVAETPTLEIDASLASRLKSLLSYG